MADDVRYATNAQRHAARAEIVKAVQKVLLTRPRDEWLALFVQANVPVGPVNPIDQVRRDPQLIGRGLFFTARAGECLIPQVGLGIAVDGSSATYRLAPLPIGEHTHEVLQTWLGYDAPSIGALREKKVSETTAKPRLSARASPTRLGNQSVRVV